MIKCFHDIALSNRFILRICFICYRYSIKEISCEGGQFMNDETKVTVNREYKSNVFSILLHDKKRLLELYNALNQSHYTKEEELEIVTLKNAI